MPNRIPDKARSTVKQRSHGRCERCGCPAPVGAWHHRRGRSVRDQHTHCPCNGVWLCHLCHVDVHAHPAQAQATGFLMSRHVNQPGTVSITTPWGRRTHSCDGAVTYGATSEQTRR